MINTTNGKSLKRQIEEIEIATQAFCEVHTQFYGSTPNIVGTFVDADVLLVTSAPDINVVQACYLEVNSTTLGHIFVPLTPVYEEVTIVTLKTNSRKLTFHCPSNMLVNELYPLMHKFAEGPIRPVGRSGMYGMLTVSEVYEYEEYRPDLPGGGRTKEEKEKDRRKGENKSKPQWIRKDAPAEKILAPPPKESPKPPSKESPKPLPKDAKKTSSPKISPKSELPIRDFKNLSSDEVLQEIEDHENRRQRRPAQKGLPPIVINNNFGDKPKPPGPPPQLMIEFGKDFELPKRVLVTYFRSTALVVYDYARSALACFISLGTVYYIFEPIKFVMDGEPKIKSIVIACLLILAYDYFIRKLCASLVRPSNPDMMLEFVQTPETMTPQKRHLRNRQITQVPTLLQKYKYEVRQLGLENAMIEAIKSCARDHRSKIVRGESVFSCIKRETARIIDNIKASTLPVLDILRNSPSFLGFQTPTEIVDQFFKFGDVTLPKTYWVSEELSQKLMTPKHVSGHENLDLTMRSINQSVINASDSAFSTVEIEQNAVAGSAILAKHVAIGAFHEVNSLGFDAALLNEYLNMAIVSQNSQGLGGQHCRPNQSEILKLNYWMSRSAFNFADQYRRALDYTLRAIHYLILIYLILWVLFSVKLSGQQLVRLCSSAVQILWGMVLSTTTCCTDWIKSAFLTGRQ